LIFTDQTIIFRPSVGYATHRAETVRRTIVERDDEPKESFIEIEIGIEENGS